MFSIKKLTSEQKNIRKKILEVSFQNNYSHIGSCFSAVDLIDAVYRVKKKDEHFVLSNGHAGIALYTILETYGLADKEALKDLHIHPDRNPNLDIQVSTGSLGQGLPIAVGMALSNRRKNIYCMISDGECAEGSTWEALRVASENKLGNLKVMLNANGWGAYNPIDLKMLKIRLMSFGFSLVTVDGHRTNMIVNALKRNFKTKPLLIFANTYVDQLPFLRGQEAHYYVMTEKDYRLAKKLLQ